MYSPLTKLLITQEYQLKQRNNRWSAQSVELHSGDLRSHAALYLLYRREMRAYTAPPMHSGYSRYDRYFMAFRETHRASRLEHICSTVMLPILPACRTPLSSSPTRLVFHTVFKKKKKKKLRQRGDAHFGVDDIAVLSNTPGMLACLLSRKSES